MSSGGNTSNVTVAQSEESAGQPIRARLEKALALEQAGSRGEALEILERLVSQGDPDGEAFAAAARLCFAAFLEPEIVSGWSEERRDALHRALVLQETPPYEAPALHARIAANHAAGIAGSLAGAAAALIPTLSGLWNEGRREPGFLLMVLLLRRHLAGWRRGGLISEWHLDLLPRLGRGHMSLPYNAAFDRESFRDNVEDVAEAVRSASTQDLARRFAPSRILLLHFIIGGRFLDHRLGALVEALKRRQDRRTEDAAALRSLSLRAAALGQGGAADEATCGEVFGPWRGSRLRPEDDTRAQRAAGRLDSTPWRAIGAARGAVGLAAPFLKTGRRKPRIAVCVSGQLRGYRRAFQSWGPGLLAGAEASLFVHVWKSIGSSGAEPYRAHLPFLGRAFCEAYRREALRIGMGETAARYPSLFSRLALSGAVTRDELSAFYGTDEVVVEDDTREGFTGWSNSRKMHHKIAAAQDLADDRLDAFDLVLRIRPDKELGRAAFVWSDVVAAAARPVIFADVALGHQYANPIIGDQFAVGAPGPMRLYAGTVRSAPRLCELGMFECPTDFHGHASLARTCWHAGLDVRRFPVRMGALLEPDAMNHDDVAASLAEDARGRMDAMDRVLIDANRRDIAS